MVTDNGETDEIFKVKKQKVYEITSKAEEQPESTCFRPHDIQPEVVDTLQENFKQLLGLGFLTQAVTSSDVGQLLKVQQSGARPGRPVTVPISYEDMLNIDKWDDSKFVFKKAQDGVPDGVADMNAGQFNGGGVQMVAQVQGSQRKGPDERNVDECVICFGSGVLICCDDCPNAFHSDCLGYYQHLPRGKWKCYFCKVIRHGIPEKVTRLAPNQKPICDVLAEKKCPNWETKAHQLFDILEEYPCAKSFFEPLNLTAAQIA